MYDWIPMEFDFEYRDHDIDYYEFFHCIANNHSRQTFTVYDAQSELCNDEYDVQALLHAMRTGSKIDGMTITELKYRQTEEENEILPDIHDLI